MQQNNQIIIIYLLRWNSLFCRSYILFKLEKVFKKKIVVLTHSTVIDFYILLNLFGVMFWPWVPGL